MKYSTWIGLITAIAVIAVCFMPWTYHADIDKTFTGFFSEKNSYGKPGKFFLCFAIAYICLSFIQKIWAKRINLFLSAVMVAYAIKSYILFTSCYNAYCPEKKIGIYLLLACNLAMLITAIFPGLKLEQQEDVEGK
ncbi:MAG: hypothetical protein ABIO04_10455 [Ferruginibacter sp.]